MTTSVDDPIIYMEWQAGLGEHWTFWGTVRVVPAGGRASGHDKMHLTIWDEEAPSGFRNVNNVDNSEQLDGDSRDGVSYWYHR